MRNSRAALAAAAIFALATPVLAAVTIGSVTNANPHLWSDFDNYKVSTAMPTPGEWYDVGQFCSILAAEWLKGTPAKTAAFKFANLGDKTAAANKLIEFLQARDGLAAQVAYASTLLGGADTAKDTVIAKLGTGGGSYAAGTQIWAGTNEHAVAIYVVDAAKVHLYDPETGEVHELHRGAVAHGHTVAQYFGHGGPYNSLNKFVVKSH